MNIFILLIAFSAAALLTGADQLIKYWAVENLKGQPSKEFIKIGNTKILNLTYLENDGAVFGSFSGMRWVLLGITSLLMIFCIYYLFKHNIELLTVISMTLIISGGFGNIIDRLFRGGLVVDYVGIASALKQAMNDYTSRDKKNYGDTDVAKVAYPKFLEKLSVCRDMFHGYDYSKFTGGTDLERAKTISGAVNFIMDREKADDKDSFVKEALMLHQALSLCSSLVDGESRFEAAFFESVRVLVLRLTNTGVGKKISLPEMNARIKELLKQSIKSDGVINLFSDIKEEFSLFDPKFLEEVSNMKEKNLAVELLKKLIAEQVSVYRRTNVVKSEKFSEIMQRSLNAYLNGMLTNEEVIEEMLNLAKQIAAAQKEGDQLGLTADELAFYDALTKPQAIKDFYENEELIAITKELADTLRRNKTIDWQKRESARAKMRMLIKKLLKKHKYPPEGMEDAVQTVMTQCELWTDNNDMGEEKVVNFRDKSISYAEANYAPMMVAEGTATYGEKK